MLNRVKNISGKVLAVILLFTVITINFPTMLMCSSMKSSGYCKMQQRHSSCCPDKKPVSGKSLTSHCGDCPCVNVATPDDLFINNVNTKHTLSPDKNTFAVQPVIYPAQLFTNVNLLNDLPPPHAGCETFLFNLNLRI